MNLLKVREKISGNRVAINIDNIISICSYGKNDDAMIYYSNGITCIPLITEEDYDEIMDKLYDASKQTEGKPSRERGSETA
jgi:hypothetical protein